MPSAVALAKSLGVLLTVLHRPRVAFRPPLGAIIGARHSCALHEASPTQVVVHCQETPHDLTLTASLDHETSIKLDIQDWHAKEPNIWCGTIAATSAGAATDLLSRVRKSQHIAICQHQDVEASDRYTGFEALHFAPVALPQVSWDDLDTSALFLGRRFAAPLLITGMTGGIEQGATINRRLAKAAAALNIPMGVGSQRVALDNPDLAAIFQVKSDHPNLFLIGNLGAAQLCRDSASTLDYAQRAVEMIQADALAIHLNVVQELVQPEGDRDFRGLLEQIAAICEHINVPIVVKEVGSGIDPESALRLKEAGVAAIDVGGRGGTSWGYIEGLRSQAPGVMNLAQSFRDWGIPTAHAIAALRTAGMNDMTIVATGGIRSGVMAAKAVALGADMVGIGLPLLRAALSGEEAVSEILEQYVTELKLCMLATSSATLGDLSRRLHYGRPFADAMDQRIQQLREQR